MPTRPQTEPRADLAPCPDSCDDGVLPVSTFDSRPDRECDRCLGEGFVDRAELAEDGRP